MINILPDFIISLRGHGFVEMYRAHCLQKGHDLCFPKTKICGSRDRSKCHIQCFDR